MPGEGGRVLSVAVRTGRMACVVIDDGNLIIWDASRKAVKTEAQAARKLRRWICEFRPDVLVTENPDSAGQKRGAQLRILKTLGTVAEDQPILNMMVRRQKHFKNAYLEAEDLGQQFPDIKHLVPKKPPIWKSEPYNLACFEALALARDAGLLEPLGGDELE
ncbi:hypothetical protein [Pseudohalocynthiibacter sp. F2068]|uniref:hypothetical protein n=1 Tax=Pseudohalocynthiibacter sp. F2068 TaxID=2926418 RepID=UPI001FF2EE72|nr:hypothetical protein [Pseudohalocynthiibacter sp. F2068]MCK0103222.1 hypothetical protein [Pseudohalocynthiibacter sp. F2068]